MSISLTTTPAANVAAFAPVIVAGTTTRNPFTADGLRDSKSISAYSNYGGYVQLTVVDGDDWEFEDTILISGGIYAGRAQITSVASTYIVTSIVYTSSETVGTVYRMNEGLAIMIRVLNESLDEIATMYSDVYSTDGTFSHDISKVLRYELSSYFSITGGEISSANASHEYTVQLCESWLDHDYLTETSAFDTTFNTIGHLTTSFPSVITFGGRGNGYFDYYVMLHYYDPIYPAALPIRFVITTAAGVTNTAALTSYNNHYAYNYSTSETWIRAKVQANDSPGHWFDLTSEIILKAVGCTGQVLHYLDRYGNYLQYGFHNYDDHQATTKINKYTGEAWKERTLYGIPFMNDEYTDIRDVITSSEVYDEDLTQVYVTTPGIEYRGENVEPIITLRYDENFIQ